MNEIIVAPWVDWIYQEVLWTKVQFVPGKFSPICFEEELKLSSLLILTVGLFWECSLVFLCLIVTMNVNHSALGFMCYTVCEVHVCARSLQFSLSLGPVRRLNQQAIWLHSLHRTPKNEPVWDNSRNFTRGIPAFPGNTAVFVLFS